MNGKETIELIAALLGGMKRDESRLTPKAEEREAKRKASEPNIEISGLQESRSTHHRTLKKKWKE